MKMNKMDLIQSFKAMMTVARHYDLQIDSKFEELDEQLLLDYDLNVHDMLGSMEHVYNELKDRR